MSECARCEALSEDRREFENAIALIYELARNQPWGEKIRFVCDPILFAQEIHRDGLCRHKDCESTGRYPGDLCVKHRILP